MADEFKGDPDNMNRLLSGLVAGVLNGSVDRMVLNSVTTAVRQLQSLYETTTLEKRMQEIERKLNIPLPEDVL